MVKIFRVIYNQVENNEFYPENTEFYKTWDEAEAEDLFAELTHKAGMEAAILEFEDGEMISYDYHGERAYDLWVAKYES